jgi:hypothetical protein
MVLHRRLIDFAGLFCAHFHKRTLFQHLESLCPPLAHDKIIGVEDLDSTLSVPIPSTRKTYMLLLAYNEVDARS